MAGRGQHPGFRVLNNINLDNYLGSDSTVQAVSSISTASWEFEMEIMTRFHSGIRSLRVVGFFYVSLSLRWGGEGVEIELELRGLGDKKHERAFQMKYAMLRLAFPLDRQRSRKPYPKKRMTVGKAADCLVIIATEILVYFVGQFLLDLVSTLNAFESDLYGLWQCGDSQLA